MTTQGLKFNIPACVRVLEVLVSFSCGNGVGLKGL